MVSLSCLLVLLVGYSLPVVKALTCFTNDDGPLTTITDDRILFCSTIPGSLEQNGQKTKTHFFPVMPEDISKREAREIKHMFKRRVGNNRLSSFCVSEEYDFDKVAQMAAGLSPEQSKKTALGQAGVNQLMRCFCATDLCNDGNIRNVAHARVTLP